MNTEKMTHSLDTPPTNPYLELKEQRPDLFEPIPARIGTTNEHPEGFPNGVVDGWRDIGSAHFHEVLETN